MTKETNESQNIILSFAIINTNTFNHLDIIKKYYNIDFINILYVNFNTEYKFKNILKKESLPIIHEMYNNYISFISPLANSIFIKKYNKDIIIKENNNNIFLIQKNNNSSIIIINYFYKNKKAIHVKYIAKKTNDLNTLIGFINYIKEYILENNIDYFSIAGITKLHSFKWKLLLKKKFQNVYISPTYADKFITCINKELGICTPDFLLISQKLAPYGVYFYITDIFTYNLNKFSLIAEIYDGKNYKKNINDKTEDIYNYALNNKLLPDLKLINQSINLNIFDLNQINVYEKFDIKNILI